MNVSVARLVQILPDAKANSAIVENDQFGLVDRVLCLDRIANIGEFHLETNDVDETQNVVTLVVLGQPVLRADRGIAFDRRADIPAVNDQLEIRRIGEKSA